MTVNALQSQAIIAHCTPQGVGALALLRVSGPTAIDIVAAVSRLGSGKSLKDMPTHTIHYGYIVDTDKNDIDQVLFMLMRAPRTFTGEDTVEISCHNNPFIIDGIIRSVIAAGARIAQPGEFTRRAVLNKKIDLLQAEAIHELIHAGTSVALKKSLAQLQGTLSHVVVEVEQNLLQALAFASASFEFLDEEISFGCQIADCVGSALDKVKSAYQSYDSRQTIKNGVRIVIVGAANVGKSSLFNALLHKERSIVTEIPGTTRDTVEAGLYKNGNFLTIIDTAGIRQTEDRIEHEGIERSYQEAVQADIVLLVMDASRAFNQHEYDFYSRCLDWYKDKLILVYNKTDRAVDNCIKLDHPYIDCSCVTKQNIDILEQHIMSKITALFAAIQSPFLLNERQARVFESLVPQLEMIASLVVEPIAYEIVAEHLKDVLEVLSELTGKAISEQSMDLIFEHFCVGK